MHGTRMLISHCGPAQDAAQLKQHLAECGAHVAHSFRLIPGVAATMTPDALKSFFARYPNARVVPDRRRNVPPRPFGKDEWAEVTGPDERVPTTPDKPEMSPLALSIMKADEVHTQGIDGSGVRVCIIDSGVDFSHPDLQGTALVDPDGRPLAADFTETDLTDTLGHGTAVAGCVAAQARQVYTITDEQSGKPVAYTKIKGIAPGARLMSAKVFDTRVASGYDSTIIAALEWAAENGVHIINLSLGGVALPEDGNDPLAAAVTALRERGVLVTVSAGNEGGGYGSVSSPGSSPGALTVGASTMYRSFAELGFLAESGKYSVDQLASFSSQGPTADGRHKPEILAPGAFDWGLAPVAGSEEGQLFQLFGGTSQSAPLMAGASALIYQGFFKAKGRFPTPDEFQRIACGTADDLGFEPYMQGAGRVNCLKAVQAAQGSAAAITLGAPRPVVAVAGQETTVSLDVTNQSSAQVDLPVQATLFGEDRAHMISFHGEIATAESTQHLVFRVSPGTDLMQVTLAWPTEDHSLKSPRLLVALYDPDGRFVNYQRPNSSGDMELGKSVDTWVARPQPGQWTARIVLRLGARDTVQPYTLTVRPFRKGNWSWIKPEAPSVGLTAGETRPLTFTVKVPEDTLAGTYSGHVRIGSVVAPLSVVVPMALSKGVGSFAGTFQHGYQGSWGNGDWHYHDVIVAPGTRSLIASVQWPDPDNALEFYLVDPTGVAVMGRSNNMDIADDGDSDVLGGQMVLANPEPGTWRLVLHSFAFSGRGQPEPYFGTVEAGCELISPRTIQMKTPRGENAPLALGVRNPGRLPLTVQAVAQSSEARLVWQPLRGEIKTGTDNDGKAQGEGHLTLATVNVPHGARQLGVVITWDQPDTAVSLSIFDPVAQNDRGTVSSTQGQLLLMENNPVPGEWTIIAGVVTPGVETQTITVKGATFMVAPEPLSAVETAPVIVQPGSQAVLPITLKLPENASAMAGRIVVTSTRGDRLGEVPFLVQVDEPGDTAAEVAATKK